MATVVEDLVAYLKADSDITAITQNIHVNFVPESKSKPYIFIQLISREVEARTLGGNNGPSRYRYVLECTSNKASTSKSLMDECLSALDQHTGTMGSRTVAFTHADDLDDNYESRQLFGDNENLHVSAMELSIGIDAR